MKNEKIFITGGAGYLGQNLCKYLSQDNEIIVYSRDESKHYYMQKQFPNVRFIIGDIRNKDYLIRKSKGCTVGIFAASLKQIDACTNNYEEASKTIIDGAINSRLAAEENGFKSASFISSDKSRAATTIYGAMKYVAGESFIVGDSNCNLTTLIYGNVANSTGSIIPLIWNCIKNNRCLTLYEPSMTRFWIDIKDAVDLIVKAQKYKGCNIIPKIKSFCIEDLCKIYSEKFGLKYTVGTPRVGEKIHEIMASNEEIRRLQYVSSDNLYVLYPDRQINNLTFPNNEYSSKDFCMNTDELLHVLEDKDFYKL